MTTMDSSTTQAHTLFETTVLSSDPVLPAELTIPVSDSDCGCDAKLADLTAAVQEQTQKISELISATNTVGSLVQSIVDRTNGFFTQFAGMNPMQIIKGALSGR